MEEYLDISSLSDLARDLYLRENWCDDCGKADLGFTEPRLYVENGRKFVSGSCKVCGADCVTELKEIIVCQIYVYLEDEGTNVWRPVDAEYLGGNKYKIISSNPNGEDEKWQFQEGDIVGCEAKLDRIVAVKKIGVSRGRRKLSNVLQKFRGDALLREEQPNE